MTAKAIALGLAAVLTAGLIGLAGLPARLAPACETTIRDRLASPSGPMIAVVFDVDCGATTGFNRQVALAPAGRPFDREASPPFLVLAGEASPGLAFTGDRLIVRLPPGTKVVRNDAGDQGVTVVGP